MVLLLLCVRNVGLEANIFEPVSVPQLYFELVKAEKLNSLNLANQVLLAKLLITLLFIVVATLFFRLTDLRLVAKCTKD